MATENNPLNISASTALVSAMSQMMLDPDFADLNVKSGSFTLLSSPPDRRFSKRPFHTNMKEKLSRKIEIKDMDPEAMVQVINFMYGIRVEKGPIKELFEAAERFQMKDLMDDVSKLAMNKMSSNTVLEIGRVAELYSVELLLEACAEFVVENDVEVNEDMPPKLATKVVRILKEELKVSKYALEVSEARRTLELQISSMQDLYKEINAHKESSNKFNVTIQFYLTQGDLKKLAQSNLGRQMEELEIHPEYDEEVPVLDYSEVPFFNLKRLTIHHQPMKAVHFTKEMTPILESLTIEMILPEVETFHLDLPELGFMSVTSINVLDPTGFGSSLSRSPKLESFFGYRFWGLHVPRSKTHKLVLPNCQCLDLYRSDGLNYLKIWAPRLQDLSLRACFALEEVTILDRKPSGYSGPDYVFTGTPSQYEVNLINTDFAEYPRGNVTTHQRCSNIITEENEIF